MACYCGKPWMSVLPPPPCPYHDRVDRWAFTGTLNQPCKGRHCAHDARCFPAQYTATWNG